MFEDVNGFGTVVIRPPLKNPLKLIIAPAPKSVTEGQAQGVTLARRDFQPGSGRSRFNVSVPEIIDPITMLFEVPLLAEKSFHSRAGMIQQCGLQQDDTVLREQFPQLTQQLLQSARVGDQTQTDDQVILTPGVFPGKTEYIVTNQFHPGRIFYRRIIFDPVG